MQASLSTRRIDAIWLNGVVGPFSSVSIHRRHALENRGMVGKRSFFNPLLPPMGRFGTREEKHYPNWVLGVQPLGQHIGAKLFRLLPARFRRGDHDASASASLYQKPLPEMARSTRRQGCGKQDADAEES